jgi:hypothetical protein
MPADHVVASLVAILGTYTLPLLAPFAGRFGRRAIIRGVVLCTLASAVSVAVFCARSPFDARHQRRLLVLHMHNVRFAAWLANCDLAHSTAQTTTGEENLQLAAIEGAPGMDKIVAGLSSSLGAPGAVAETVQMGDHTSDWDVIYPVSAVRLVSVFVGCNTYKRAVSGCAPHCTTDGLIERGGRARRKNRRSSY